MNNNEVLAKKHTLCEKAPFLAMILGCLIASVVIGVPTVLAGDSFGGQIVPCIAAAVCLIGFNRWFAPEFKGVFKAGISAGEILIISLPFLFKLVFSYAATVFDSGFYFNPTLLSLAMALSAGFFEETIFRGVTIPLAMRYLKSKNRMYIIVGITAFIFGILHIGNIVQGANPTMAVIQSISTIFGGFLYAAVYLRSGSILAPILMHALYDYICFVTDPTLDNGIMTSETVTIGIILTVVVFIIADIWSLYLIRPSMRDKIQTLWNEKWGIEAGI